jgi:hypothetical protein
MLPMQTNRILTTGARMAHAGNAPPSLNPLDALLVPPALVKRALDDLHEIAELARRYAGLEDAVSARTRPYGR